MSFIHQNALNSLGHGKYMGRISVRYFSGNDFREYIPFSSHCVSCEQATQREALLNTSSKFDEGICRYRVCCQEHDLFGLWQRIFSLSRSPIIYQILNPMPKVDCWKSIALTASFVSIIDIKCQTLTGAASFSKFYYSVLLTIQKNNSALNLISKYEQFTAFTCKLT